MKLVKNKNKKNFWVGFFWFLLVGALTALAVAVFIKPNFFRQKKTVAKNEYEEKAYNSINEGKFGEAEKILKEAIEKNPQDCMAKLYLANVYLEEGYVGKNVVPDTEAALKILSDLKEKKECQIGRADILMGYAYELTGDWEKAQSYYDEALSKNNNDPDALFHKGHINWLLGDLEKAEDFYLKAEENLSADVAWKGLKGKIFLSLGKISAVKNDDWKKTKEYFQKALEETDSKSLRAEIYYDLSTINFYNEIDLAKSLENGLKSIENDPYNELGYVACAREKIMEFSLIKDKSKITKEDLESVNQYLQRATLLNPKRALVQYWYGQFTFLIGDTKEALKRYDVALSQVEGDDSLGKIEKNFFKSEVLTAKSMVYLSLKENKNAEKALKEAYALNPVKTSFMMEAMK